ncbi:hypothetical protein GQ44DRAFT_714134 [Phaeosphaeriaceae sp. PMI808]|nr:hypothetical protein GQ44DRAFT_714134 [Phaeosphaeriaceae sp. PMI808]
MSRLACVWADLADDTDAAEWYEDTHLPNVVSKLGLNARNAEQVADNMFKEVAGIDGKYMTVYDIPENEDAQEVTAQTQPEVAKLPKGARLDTRVYDEYATWYGREWLGHSYDVQMFIIVLWQPAAAVHDGFVEWFQTEFAPGMLECPELLRARILKLQHASVFENGETKEKNTNDMYQYITVWEFECDDLPWEILVYLGSSERWRYYVEGGHLQWQIAQYLVNRIYPENTESDSPATKRASIMVNGYTYEGEGGSEDEQEDGQAP